MAVPRFLEFAQNYPGALAGLSSGIGAGVQEGTQIADTFTKIRAQKEKKAADAAKAAADDNLKGLTGPAGSALSTVLFKKHYKDDPAALGELKNAQDAADRSANARYFMGIPSDERGELIAKAKTLGFDQMKAVQLFSKGYTLQDLVDLSKVGKNPAPAGSKTVPTPSNAHNETPDTVQKSLDDVTELTKPLSFKDITPRFAATAGVKEQAQKAASASAGLHYMGSYITNNINYGGVTTKVTRPWLQDAYSNDPIKQDKAVGYYAAQAIKPELSMYRMKVMGGMASARAIAAIEPTILGHVNVDLNLMPVSIQRRVQQRAVDVLTETSRQSQLQVLKPNPTVFTPDVHSGKNISSDPEGQAKQTDKQKWMSDAREDNPKSSEKELSDYYDKKYGGQ